MEAIKVALYAAAIIVMLAWTTVGGSLKTTPCPNPAQQCLQ